MTANIDHPKRCLSIFKKLSEYLDDELDGETNKAITGHLKKCLRCQVCLETLKRTIDLLKNMKTGSLPERIPKPLKRVVSSKDS